MNCMKCGKETAEEQVFCDSCLEVMGRYPVKPETVVQLPPQRLLGADKKAPRKRDVSPKEALRRQRKLLKVYRLIAAALLLLLAVTTGLLVYVLWSQTTFFDFIPFLH